MVAWVAITERPQNPKWHGEQNHYAVYLCTADHTVRVALRFTDHSFSGAAIASKGLRLVTCSFPSLTRIWDIESGEQIGSIPTEPIQAVACDRNGELVVTASYDGIISLWKLESLIGWRRDATGHTRAVVDAKVSSDGLLGFTVAINGTANTWDLKTGALVASIAPEARSAGDVDWSVMTARVDVDKGRVDFLIRDADFRWAIGEVSSYDLATGTSVVRHN